MTKRMLIDASHAEETRVVVLDGNRLEDFDVETSTKRQLKGNIYLAKVVRVEPSLQAAFVEYGGGRHGFLAFDEIHPDYYQIPVADRQRLLEMQAEDAAREAAEEDRAADAAASEEVPTLVLDAEPVESETIESETAEGEPEGEEPADAEDLEPGPGDSVEAIAEQASETPVETLPADDHVHEAPAERATDETGGETRAGVEAPEPDEVPGHRPPAMPAMIPTETLRGPIEADAPERQAEEPAELPLLRHAEAHEAAAEATPPASAPAEASTAEVTVTEIPVNEEPAAETASDEEPVAETQAADAEDAPSALADTESHDIEALPNGETIPPSPPPETVGGEADTVEEVRERRMPRFLRSYKIQEVIKRRQILLVQVVKEERGTKGAALTTYISLAGRFCVLMPNSPRGGGISRKITSAADRRRLKEITAELDIPQGMGLIVRTAGANRPKPEIRRDCEYLLRLWDDIREHTLRSVAPALIYEEASLIKRAIRDVYSRDVDEILVDGEEGWKAARDFMRMLMPSHAKKVILWRGDGQPLFAKHQVDAQLDAMLQPTVQLKSGGYLVINQTEALVAIDVNSGRSTRERGIEETALRTNLEAAAEVARQLRLRDLAGLVVIDFIDMESKKHNSMVERRMKEALKDDRARIQVGSISHFGLLEMSRQRLRPSLAESSFVICPHCGGLGHVRSTESSAIHVLRHIEEEGAKRRAAEIVVHVATPIAMYVLNAKRERLREIEQRYAMRVLFEGDDSLIAPQLRIDRVRAQVPSETAPAIGVDTPQLPAPPPIPPALPAAGAMDEDEAYAADEEDEVTAEGDEDSEGEDGTPQSVAGETAEEGERRRRRRRRRRGGRREDAPPPGETVHAEAAPTLDAQEGSADEAAGGEDEEDGEETAEPLSGEDGRPGEDGTQRPRRRGRRGGRRRRREPGDQALPEIAALDAEQPDVPGVPYSGPTPADPFGGGFDIFDVMDQVERAAEHAERRMPAPAAASEAGHAAATHAIDESAAEPPAEALHAEPVRSSVVAVPIVEGPAPEVPSAPEEAAFAPEVSVAPAVAAEEPAGPTAEPEAVMAEPANDVTAEPAIRPIIIGSAETPPAEKKHGWWRR